MKEKKVTKIQMNGVKGGFKPRFEVSEELSNREFPNLIPVCVPPPNERFACFKCDGVFV